MLVPEQVILLINISIVLVSYFVIYPRFVGNNLNKLTWNDIVASVVSVSIVGSLYWGSQIEFNLLVTKVNWFWFSFNTYLIIEAPLSLWYIKKHKVFQ